LSRGGILLLHDYKSSAGVDNLRPRHDASIRHPRPFAKCCSRDNYQWSATGEVTFKIDLENTSEDRAVNLQAIYFYSTKVWALFQDDKECPSTAPDADFANEDGRSGIFCSHRCNGYKERHGGG
jgi:hypothetical protein